MFFSNLLKLYDINSVRVSFKHVYSKELDEYAKIIHQFHQEIKFKYENSEDLLEVLRILKKSLFNYVRSLQPYNKVLDEELNKQILKSLYRIKNSYPTLLDNIISPIAKTLYALTHLPDNQLYKFLCDYINESARIGMRIAIVSKRNISYEEQTIINQSINTHVIIKYFSIHSFMKNLETFDEIIYLGNSQYFGDYATNTFKGKHITFITYSFFSNKMQKKNVFDQINANASYSTLFQHVVIDNPITQKEFFSITEEKEELTTNINKYVENIKEKEHHQYDVVDASVVYLENDRILFVPIHSKIRIFDPDSPKELIKQIESKELEEDDYIILRNDRDTKLIAEVADQEILKERAVNYRQLQKKWKKHLIYNVRRKGYKRVGEILKNKYHVSTASAASVRNWCSEESICPIELPKILKAFKYEEQKIKKIVEAMKEIQQAHRKAGRIISSKLMNELSINIVNELRMNGYFTFESKEFDGASFNIERVVAIDNSKHLVSSHNIMKPLNIG
ncbi:DISARM anti-phage system protein DrmE domain-containing protein [Bacillus smithii]|uniref:DISARM protein DrmE C-terminal domain-containing protein n=1 Tax=Bacillus smithii 7_3_47FAA TaxID=665952 RepID=G9QHK7_9BACI|nr:hypothetical protein [Bacillus smithii]EHL79385.1 hypothetical protein HMPREF1015_01266 [Bacillus smithii 7_3_47FAA]